MNAQLNNDLSRTYLHSPILNAQNHIQSMAKLYQINQSESNSPVYDLPPPRRSSILARVNRELESQQGISPSVQPDTSTSGGFSPQSAHQLSSTPFERLINEQYKVLPTSNYSPQPPIVIEPTDASIRSASIAPMRIQSVPASRQSHHHHAFNSQSQTPLSRFPSVHNHHQKTPVTLSSHRFHSEAQSDSDDDQNLDLSSTHIDNITPIQETPYG